MRAWWLHLSLAILIVSIGCTDALIIYERDAGDDASIPDAGRVDSGPPDAGDPCRAPQDLQGIPEDCRLERPPPRPLCDEAGDVPPFEVGFLGPDFGDAVGFDLDGYCTPRVGPASCTNAIGTIPDTTVGGTDNAFGLVIMVGLRIFDPAIEEEFAQTARDRGVGVPMVRVEGWNGLADDDEVMVTFAVGAALGSETPVLDSGAPFWDSGEVQVRPADDFFNSAGAPLARDLTAYVSDGRLVVSIPESLPFDFAANGRRLSIALRDARLVIGLTPGEGSAALDDFTIFGRWPVAEAREAVVLLVPCSDEAVRNTAVNLLATAADVRSDRAEDGAMLECNAISIALRFTEAYPIRWGASAPLELDPMCM